MIGAIIKQIIYLMIYYFVLLACCLLPAAPSSLCLESPQSTSKKIPLSKIHPYSCQLLYFKVHQSLLSINVTDIPPHVDRSIITLIFNIGSLHNISQSLPVATDKIYFQFNFSDVPELAKNESIELNVEIDLEFINNSTETQKHSIVAEKRRVYLIFAICNDYYKVKLPVMAIIVTQLVGLICILLLPLNVRYRRFLPFSFNLLTSFLYLCVLVVALYLQMIFPTSDPVYYVQRVVVSLFSLGCLFLYAQDLLCFVLDEKRVIMGVAVVFSVGVILCDELVPVLEDSWFLNNMVAFMVAGAFIKFVIIRRLKTAIWALGLLWAFSWLRHFAIQLGLQEYDQGTGIRIVPLFLQIPKIWLLDDQADYACSAFGSSKIISFGVVLNYCKRVDLYLSTHFYRKLGWVLAVFCVLFELGYNILEQDLPTMEVMSVILFYPLVTLLMLFFANKRGEWAEIWHGSFYDMAVNRASIPREVSFDSIRRSFGEDLLINKGSLERED